MDSGRDTVPLTPDGVPFPGITLLHTRFVSSNVCCWDNILSRTLKEMNASSSVHVEASSSTPQPGTDLWSDILRSADRSNRGRPAYGRKNIVLLCTPVPFDSCMCTFPRLKLGPDTGEPHHGRKYLLNHLLSPSTNSGPSKRRPNRAPALAMGYEVLQLRDDGDEGLIIPQST
jgi:dynein light intermediate chain 1